MRRVFAGDRRVWYVAGAVLAIGAVLIAYYLLRSEEHFLGTNSVGVRGLVADVPPHDRLCVPDLDVPDGTARVQLTMMWGGKRRPPLDVALAAGDRVVRNSIPAAAAAAPYPVSVDVPVPEVDISGGSALGRLCVTPVGARINVAGTADLQADQRAPTLDGKRLRARVAVRFLGQAGDESTVLSLLPDAFRRAAVLRPGVVAPWWYAALFLVLLPALAIASVRLVAVAAAGGGRTLRTAVALAVIAFLNAAAWGLITPAWQGPDEPDHFSYAQSLAERGEAPAKQPSDAAAFSTRLVTALNAARAYSVVGLGDTRPPWLRSDDEHYGRLLDEDPGREDNGGGYLVSTSAHLPGYYGLTLPAYWIADSQSTFSELTTMRLVSALLGALAAVCAFAAVRELSPRRPWLAVAAALLVAFQPMAAFMFGVVNNDAGVNAAAALLVFLLIRGLRRGLTLPLGLALGATLVLLPAMKATGTALYPAAAVGLAGMLWRRHSRADLSGYGAVAAAAGLLYALRAALVSALEAPAQAAAATGAAAVGGASAGGVIERVLGQPDVFLSYTWQLFLPRLWFMNDLHVQKWPAFDIFIERGWASFGWVVVQFPHWVYVVIVAASLAAGVLAAVALGRRRAAAKRLGWELAVLALVAGGVVFGVEGAYFADAPRPVPAEQGRYVFTALVPFAAIAVGSSLAFRERVAPLVATGLAAAVIVLGYASQLLTLSWFFT